MNDEMCKKFCLFLINAKRNTYANALVEKVKPSRCGSCDYEYSDDNYIYHDTYFGGTRFMGEEVVYEQGKSLPMWGMNYYVTYLDESLSEEILDKVLRPALMEVGTDFIYPLRGSKRFEVGEYLYTFEVDGELYSFEGVEKIYKNGQEVYCMKCCGGFIK